MRFFIKLFRIGYYRKWDIKSRLLNFNMGLKYSRLLYLLAVYTIWDKIKNSTKDLVVKGVIYKSSLWDK